jgi:Polyketide cyclase / dehydrase and lipid transport
MSRPDASPLKSVSTRAAGTLVSVCALALLGANARPASAESLSRSTDVKGTPAEVWAMIGPFCAIKDWHPAIGTCTEDGQAPPVRTLVTKDGKVTFVEMQTARSDTKFIYAYNFISSPFPVTHYAAQIEVAPKSAGVSTVTWSGAYIPNPGKEKEALDALRGVYETGLAAIKAKRAK